MRHPLPWHTTWPLNVVDAAGNFVCEAKDAETAQEIVALSVAALTAPPGPVGPKPPNLPKGEEPC